jgi:signal transduction histidine kinase
MFERTWSAEERHHTASGPSPYLSPLTPLASPPAGAPMDEAGAQFVAGPDAPSGGPLPGGSHIGSHIGRIERQRARVLQWLQMNTFVPDWLPDRCRHKRAGYLLAALAQALGTLTTLLLVDQFSFFPHFAALDTLDYLTICLIALSWGAGPSLVATFIGAALLELMGLLLPQPFWPPARQGDLVDIGMFVAFGVIVTIVASRTEQLRRSNAEKYRQARNLAANLRETNQRMDTFLSLVTHELKAPLTVMGLSAALARRGLARLTNLTKRRENLAGALEGVAQETSAQGETSGEEIVQDLGQRLDTIQHQLRLQARLIDDLLDVARIQSGQLELHMASCDLAQIVLQAVEDQRLLYQNRTIRAQGLLAEDARAPGGIVIRGDADRIHQVVTNYLTNALKYSPPDRPVVVTLEREGAHARVAVRDAGPGLSAEQQAHIWLRFYRVAGVEGRSESGAGLGLGLYICKSIIERHDGAVGVESRPGHGSTFYFRLPLCS